MTPALRTATETLLALYPEPFRAAVESALPELMLDAARLGLEVLKAERAGLRFADAVRRSDDYHLMRQIHFGFIQVLEHEVPVSLVAPVRELLQRAREFDDVDLSRLLFAAAAVEDGTAERAALRFIVYEMTRAGAWALALPMQP